MTAASWSIGVAAHQHVSARSPISIIDVCVRVYVWVYVRPIGLSGDLAAGVTRTAGRPSICPCAAAAVSMPFSSSSSSAARSFVLTREFADSASARPQPLVSYIGGSSPVVWQKRRKRRAGGGTECKVAARVAQLSGEFAAGRTV